MWSAGTDCDRERSPCHGWLQNAQDGYPESKSRGRQLTERTLGCMGGVPARVKRSLSEIRPELREIHSMRSGVDHEDETELLTECPPFPVSLKFHPSNQDVRVERHLSWHSRLSQQLGLLPEGVRQDRRTGRDQVKGKVGKIPGGQRQGSSGTKQREVAHRPRTLQAPLQSRRTSAKQLVDF